MELEFYELEENILCFLGTRGDRGILRSPGGGPWEYHPPGSLAHDSFHQQVYRNFKADLLTSKGLEERGILLPDTAAYEGSVQGVRWEDNFESEVELREVPPGLRPELGRGDGEPLDVYLVLLEDAYETGFGDGRYLYPVDAFRTKGEAMEEVKRIEREEEDPAKREWYRYSLKRVRLTLDEARQRVVADLGIEPYEHYSIRDVLRLLVSSP
ncbi:MAG: hypothetical protein HYU64_14750 [Armatimonadetes bacterium]|nr:hypothetical protein [Armatimonadota bacterium]